MSGRWVGFLLVLLVSGCSQKDGDKLAKIAKLSAEKVRDAVPAKNPVGDFAPDATVAGKVRTRLKTDAYLVACPIQVVEEADGLHLRGHVPSQEHADLAYRLASQTVGVPTVVNELTIAP